MFTESMRAVWHLLETGSLLCEPVQGPHQGGEVLAKTFIVVCQSHELLLLMSALLDWPGGNPLGFGRVNWNALLWHNVAQIARFLQQRWHLAGFNISPAWALPWMCVCAYVYLCSCFMILAFEPFPSLVSDTFLVLICACVPACMRVWSPPSSISPQCPAFTSYGTCTV